MNFFRNFCPLLFTAFLCVFSEIIPTENSEEATRPHILQEPSFWSHFRSQVSQRACYFKQNDVLGSLDSDSVLYKNRTRFVRRREKAAYWLENVDEWVEFVLGAIKELSVSQGPNCKTLRDLGALEPISDYVAHLDFFHRVALRMQEVEPLSQQSSAVHDIDKLDPAMVTGYAERFEDGVETSLWKACVHRHIHMNPHHQAHCIWHGCCTGHDCDKLRETALKEMVCDKVSRNLQKSLGGIEGPSMWDVEERYFEGLSEEWMVKAQTLMQTMKRNMMDNSAEERDDC